MHAPRQQPRNENNDEEIKEVIIERIRGQTIIEKRDQEKKRKSSNLARRMKENFVRKPKWTG